MMLTWTPNPVPYDQAFEAIKAAVDAMPSGVKLLINSGTFTVDVDRLIRRLPKSVAHPVSRGILWTRLLSRKSGPTRYVLREVPRMCRQDLLVRQRGSKPHNPAARCVVSFTP